MQPFDPLTGKPTGRKPQRNAWIASTVLPVLTSGGLVIAGVLIGILLTDTRAPVIVTITQVAPPPLPSPTVAVEPSTGPAEVIAIIATSIPPTPAPPLPTPTPLPVCYVTPDLRGACWPPTATATIVPPPDPLPTCLPWTPATPVPVNGWVRCMMRANP